MKERQGDPTEAPLDAIFDGKAVRLEAEPFRPPHPPEIPNLPPSEEVHISLSYAEGTISSSAQDHWMMRGFDLRAILTEVFAINPSRLGLPGVLDKGARYDYVLIPSQEEDRETMKRQVLTGIEKFFHVTLTPTIRATDVYVMTSVGGKTPPRKSDEESYGGGAVGFASEWRELKLAEGTPPARKAFEEAARQAMASPEFRETVATDEMAAMAALSSSTDELCRALEHGLHRPIVDETGMTGI